MFALLTHPLVIFGGTIFIGTLIGIAVTGLYVPMLKDYTAGCVQSKDGTFFSKNTYAVLYNGAAFLGNKATASTVQDLDTHRALECARILGVAEVTLQEQEDAYGGIETQYAKTHDVRYKIQECIDPGVWEDEAMKVKYPNTETYQRVQIAFPGIDQSFDLNRPLLVPDVCGLENLQRLSYDYDKNCSGAKPCQIDTELTNAAGLQLQTHKTVCTGEHWLHSTILSMFCTIIVFFIWNLCRMYLLSGVTMLFWKDLSPKGFEYMGTCDRAGNPLEDSEASLAKVIVKNVRYFERRAKLYIVLAVVPNVLYFALLIFVAQAIDFPS